MPLFMLLIILWHSFFLLTGFGYKVPIYIHVVNVGINENKKENGITRKKKRHCEVVIFCNYVKILQSLQIRIEFSREFKFHLQ